MRKHSQELWLVLMVSLGASAIYSILSLARKLTSTQGLAGSVTTIIQPLAKTPWLDLVSQLASISLALVPVLLALDYWWTPVVLVLAALRSGLQEEIIAVAFFAKKLKIIRPEITIISVIILSSLFRASYHLYQGFSAFIGNFVMGLVFGYLFMRTGRVAPLVIAHTIMNTAVFIGFPLVAGFF